MILGCKLCIYLMKNFQAHIFLLIAVTLSSCVQPVYYPNKVHSPMLDRQGKFYVNLAGSGNSGWNGAIAYSPLNSIYVEVGGNIAPGINPFHSDFTTSFFYGSAGFYKWLNSRFVVEGEVGLGKGRTETYDVLSTFFYDDSLSNSGHYVDEFDHTNAAYTRWHIQGSIGLHFDLSLDTGTRKGLLFEAAITPRLSFLTTTKYNVEHFDSIKTFISASSKKYTNTFLESTLTIRFGVEYLMLELQFGVSNVIGNLQSEMIIPRDKLIIGLGLVSRF